MSKQKILGDYQTPLQLAHQIVAKLFSKGERWGRILEPTCGQGNFIQAIIDADLSVSEIIGLDIQQDYVKKASRIQSNKTKITIHSQDIFETDLATDIRWTNTQPLLIIGNPPWVTNSTLGSLNGNNAPSKSNSQKLSGLDALTGKSNFDITESIWLKLLDEFISEQVTIALLCKTSVARKIAQSIYQRQLPVSKMSVYRIDSKQSFNVAVDAGLFVVELNQGYKSYEMEIYSSLDSQQASQAVGFVNGKIIANKQTYKEVHFVDGQCPFEWRQGVKHDASKVMELSYQDGYYINGYGEQVDIEPEYIYPLIKSSDVKMVSPDYTPRKYVIITQKVLQQNTAQLESLAPNLWSYLHLHAEKLDARKSSIYTHAPRFSMFGIGDYSFAPYKVIVAGFYLPAQFAYISTVNNTVCLTDDTCYFLSFDIQWKALIAIALLNHSIVRQFIDSIVFSDAKRPITKSLLSRINLKKVYDMLEFKDVLFATHEIKERYRLDTYVPTKKQEIQSLFGRQLQLF